MLTTKHSTRHAYFCVTDLSHVKILTPCSVHRKLEFNYFFTSRNSSTFRYLKMSMNLKKNLLVGNLVNKVRLVFLQKNELNRQLIATIQVTAQHNNDVRRETNVNVHSEP